MINASKAKARSDHLEESTAVAKSWRGEGAASSHKYGGNSQRKRRIKQGTYSTIHAHYPEGQMPVFGRGVTGQSAKWIYESSESSKPQSAQWPMFVQSPPPIFLYKCAMVHRSVTLPVP